MRRPRPGAAVVRLAALVLAAATVGQLAAQAELTRLVAELGDDADPQRRIGAYQSLVRTKPPAAVPLLIEALPRYGTSSQSLGLSLLQAYPPDTGLPALRKLLRAPAPFLRLGAATILYRNGETAVLQDILEPLAQADVPAPARVLMLARVSGIGEPRLTAAVRALVRADVHATVLEAALYHLLAAADGETPAKVAALLALPDLPRQSRVACAAFVLAQGDPAHAGLIAEELADPTGAALLRLQRFLQRAPKLDAQILAILVKVVDRGEQVGGVTSALTLLGTHGTGAEVPVIKKRLQDADRYVAKAALEAIQKLTGGLSAEQLRSWLADPGPDLALLAADGLRRIDDESGLPRVIQLAGQEGAQRAEAVRVLGRFRNHQAVAPLIEALDAADATVRVAARQGLASLLPSLFPYRRFDLDTTGYDANGTAAERAAALVRIRAWWEAHRPR